MPHLNNSKSIWKNYIYTFQNISNYVFHYCIFQLDWIIDFKNDNKIIKIYAHIQTFWAEGFAPCRRTVHATTYSLAWATGISNSFGAEIETAGYDCWKFVFSWSWKNELEHFGAFCNRLEKVETENKLCDTPGNHFNIDKIDTQHK